MKKALRPNERTLISLLRKILAALGKTVVALILIALLAVFVTSVSPIYDFSEPKPFSGPDIFNPYKRAGEDSAFCWKRANFHTHTRVKGILNECEYWPAQTDEAYRKFGYDIVTFSNHNELTVHPYDSLLQVNVYEHGINLFKYHKLVFGCDEVNRFDHLIPLFASQKQFQLDMLGEESDFIQMNHPLRTTGTSKSHMQKLGGYRIMELDSGKSTENEYWDWALSAGHYSFGLANDDLHYPDKSSRIAVRCNFLCCPSARYEDIKETLLGGCYYAMRIPDYGHGDWEVKYARNRNLPSVEKIGLDGETIYIALSRQADSIQYQGDGAGSHHPVAGPKLVRGQLYHDRRRPLCTHYRLFPRRRGDLHQSVRTIRCFRNGNPVYGSVAYGEHPVDNPFQLYASCPVRGSDPYIL